MNSWTRLVMSGLVAAALNVTTFAQAPAAGNPQKAGERLERRGKADQRKGERLEKKGEAQKKAGDRLEAQGKVRAGEKLERKGERNERRGEHLEKKGIPAWKNGARSSKTRARIRTRTSSAAA